jgi:hypothetical protein
MLLVAKTCDPRHRTTPRIRRARDESDNTASFAAHRPSSTVLTLRTPIRPYAVFGRMGLGVKVGNEKLPGGTRHAGLLFWDNPMREYNEYMARVAVCEQRAKDARTESEKESWLVMADSWRETVKLQEMLTRHSEFIRKVPMPRVSEA